MEGQLVEHPLLYKQELEADKNVGAIVERRQHDSADARIALGRLKYALVGTVGGFPPKGIPRRRLDELGEFPEYPCRVGGGLRIPHCPGPHILLESGGTRKGLFSWPRILL